FLENVLDEVIALFPSKYIHIGGDECPKTHWQRCPFCQKRITDEHLKDEHELQSYFVQRIEKYVNSKGKTLIGWDEILEGGLAPNAMVMSWRGEAGGVAAAQQKHNVIMTPSDWVYLNQSQTRNEDSVTIGGYLPLEKVYRYEPIPPTLTPNQKKYVLGAQGELWTEYISNEKIAEYMLFPRMSALSEVLWSQKKDSVGFVKRLMTQFKRYDLWGANYSKAYYGLKAAALPSEDYKSVYWYVQSNYTPANCSFCYIEGEEEFTYRTDTELNDTVAVFDPSDPTRVDHYRIDKKIMKKGKTGHRYLNGQTELTVNISESNVVRVRQRFDRVAGPWLQQRFYFNKATGKKITLTTAPSADYAGDGPFTLVNGVQNEKGLDRSDEFLGFDGTDCDALIDLGAIAQIANVKAHVFEETSSWIWRPKFFQVLISPDDKIYTEMGITDVVKFNEEKTNGVMTVQQKSVAARFLKVKLGNYGVIPEGNPGAGNRAALFVDEVEVN
ncbi:MAG TPA: family 20 glycosylhydrolase, partial [Chitinophagaceae bacterium]|nr:family 20 glycosylhydrolase [Chitinophagaceae bacterium]